MSKHLAVRPTSTTLEDLKVEWRAHAAAGSRFSWDGIIEPESYSLARLRVLFVLREPSHEHDPAKETDDDLCAWLHQRGEDGHPFGSTWKPVARWASALLGVEDLQTALRQVAAINLRKEAGGKQAVMARLTRTIQRDRHFFRRQVELIAPQVIIGAGTGDELIWLFDLDPAQFIEQPRVRSLNDGACLWLLTQHPNRSPLDLIDDLIAAIPK